MASGNGARHNSAIGGSPIGGSTHGHRSIQYLLSHDRDGIRRDPRRRRREALVKRQPLLTEERVDLLPVGSPVSTAARKNHLHQRRLAQTRHCHLGVEIEHRVCSSSSVDAVGTGCCHLRDRNERVGKVGEHHVPDGLVEEEVVADRGVISRE